MRCMNSSLLYDSISRIEFYTDNTLVCSKIWKFHIPACLTFIIDNGQTYC